MGSVGLHERAEGGSRSSTVAYELLVNDYDYDYVDRFDWMMSRKLCTYTSISICQF